MEAYINCKAVQLPGDQVSVAPNISEFCLVKRRWYHKVFRKMSGLLRKKRRLVNIGEVRICYDIMLDEFGGVGIVVQDIKADDIKNYES